MRPRPFEPAVDPLRFDRLPDAQARDPEVLRRLCGTYTMGPWVMYGHISHASDEILFVTLNKKGMADTAQYDDHFLGPDRFGIDGDKCF